MAVSDVTLFELYYGAERYDDPAARIAIIEGFAARLDVLPFDSRAAVQAGNIRAGHDLGRLVHLEEAEIRPSRDVEEYAGRARDGGLEQR